MPPTSTSNYSVEGNRGYKLYDDAAVARLQQIAMYYELGLKRNEIRDIMKAPDYEVNKALDELTHALEEKRLKLDRHIAAIHSLRYVGIKNGMMGWINGIRIEELGRKILATEHSSLAKVWSADIDKTNYGISQADIYQMYAYQKKYGANHVTLVYPKTDKVAYETGMEYRSDDGVTVRIRFVDLFDVQKITQQLCADFF